MNKKIIEPNVFHQPTIGKIIQWNDERGFGFIQTPVMRDKIFFHIHSLKLNQGRFRPKEGEEIYFTAEFDGQRFFTAVFP
ncbi:MAG: cold shock domain-containing protein [Cardiobacteriaceae bacterium]|nr:cold shock domain-containing protein [Cardiobacteriaceae bacterium]